MIEAAKPYVEGRKIRFTGAVAFHENGTMYRECNKNEPHYTGYPDKDVDDAWDSLLYAAAVDLPQGIGRQNEGYHLGRTTGWTLQDRVRSLALQKSSCSRED